MPGAFEIAFAGPVYLSFDLDALDPAFAPGVSHHEPGGLSTRQAIDIIHALPIDLVGADMVELNPDRDPAGISAMAAAKLLKEIMGRHLAVERTPERQDVKTGMLEKWNIGYKHPGENPCAPVSCLLHADVYLPFSRTAAT